MSSPPLYVIDLGRQGYDAVHRLQRDLAERRIAGEISDDILLLVQHDPVVTLGRGTRESSLPFSPAALAAKGLDVADVERGGDVTYHGPGQLVGYPILDLHHHRQDLHWYLRQLEAGLISALERLGISAERRAGLTGVWTGGRKIASIGIHVRQWVTTHGFALNVLDEESGFDLIIPCGIAGVEMTTVEREGAWTDAADGDTRLHGSELWQATRESVIQEIAKVLRREPIPATLPRFLPTVPA
ncbi:MAG TPA: lipoyl(octanoyl) transferase LipB [Gemmatimonadales bacterium]|nr:lipoyl(octanoyl) transferase LipB [Gemmatimonadales bacterium]